MVSNFFSTDMRSVLSIGSGNSFALALLAIEFSEFTFKFYAVYRIFVLIIINNFYREILYFQHFTVNL